MHVMLIYFCCIKPIVDFPHMHVKVNLEAPLLHRMSKTLHREVDICSNLDLPKIDVSAVAICLLLPGGSIYVSEKNYLIKVHL